MRYLTQHTNIDLVPDRTRVDKIPATELTLDEAMFIVRLRGVLLDDYLIGDVEVSLGWHQSWSGVPYRSKRRHSSRNRDKSYGSYSPAGRRMLSNREGCVHWIRERFRSRTSLPSYSPLYPFINPAGQRCPVSKTEGQQRAFPATGERLRGNRRGVGGLHFGERPTSTECL